MDKLLTESEIAHIFGLKVRTLQNWRHKKKGPPYFKDGGLIRYRASDVEEHIASLIVDPEKE